MVAILRFLKSLLCFRRTPARRLPSGLGPKTVQSELTRLSDAIENAERKASFDKDMESFLFMYTSYLSMLYVSGHEKGRQLDWSSVRPPSKIDVTSYQELASDHSLNSLHKLAVLKLCSPTWSGTTQGLSASTTIRDGISFVELAAQDLLHLRLAHGADVPLLLMAPFTDERDVQHAQRSCNHQLTDIAVIRQSKFPYLVDDTLLPLPREHGNDHEWYTPGTGDVFASLASSGYLDKLLCEGKEYLFVSDLYNPGAAVDPCILDYMTKEHIDFLAEVTERTDSKQDGGVLVDYKGQSRILEASQIPKAYGTEFHPTLFPYKTTGSYWVNLVELKKLLDHGPLELDITSDTRTIGDGTKVVQLGSAASAAMLHFRDAQALHVPRTRYTPIHSLADLALLRSDNFTIRDGALLPNASRLASSLPSVKLDNIHTAADLNQCMPYPVSMLELDKLVVLGDVRFGKDVILRGHVIVQAKDGMTLHVPDSCVLANCLLTGAIDIAYLNPPTEF